MSYLLDKKIQRKKFSLYAFFIFIFLILFYFRSGVFNGLAYVSNKIFHPIIIVGDNIGGKFSSLGAYFSSKNSLSQENQKLTSELEADQATMSNYNSVVAENADLKDTLGRKSPKTNFVLGAILEKPNQSPYDTLLIDAGLAQGVRSGSVVFVEGNVPIGRVDTVYENTSKIVLFSNSGEKTEVVVGKNVFMEAIGRGGGNFEIIMPKDFTMQAGDQVVLPGINPYVLATVETIISDPRDSFIKALLVSPVNIQELKFVEVEN
jgi:cell shape-determining protein MreC